MKIHRFMIKSMASLCVLGILTLLQPQQALPARMALVSSVAEENKDGPDAQIIKAIAHKLQAKLILRYAPFKRRLQLMKSGEIDFMIGLLKTSQRERFIHYLLPAYKSRSDTVFFVPKGKATKVLRYEDLYRLKIGTTFGSKYFPRFDEDNRLRKEAVSSGISNFKKLLKGRIDAVVCPEGAGIDMIHQMGISDQVAIAVYRFAQAKYVYVGVSRKSDLMDQIAMVEAVVRKMVKNGDIRKIIVHYYVLRNLPVPAL
jgi:polar amino acid transport system substrate-binding protein